MLRALSPNKSIVGIYNVSFSSVDSEACCHDSTTKGLTGEKGGNAGAAGKSGNGGKPQKLFNMATDFLYLRQVR